MSTAILPPTSALQRLATLELAVGPAAGKLPVGSTPRRVLSRCWHVAGNAATIAGMKRTTLQHNAPANDAISSKLQTSHLNSLVHVNKQLVEGDVYGN
jgi:hypothetical protein